MWWFISSIISIIILIWFLKVPRIISGNCYNKAIGLKMGWLLLAILISIIPILNIIASVVVILISIIKPATDNEWEETYPNFKTSFIGKFLNKEL